MEQNAMSILLFIRCLPLLQSLRRPAGTSAAEFALAKTTQTRINLPIFAVLKTNETINITIYAPKCLCEMSLEQEKNYARYLFKPLYNPRVDLIKFSGSFAKYFSRGRIPPFTGDFSGSPGLWHATLHPEYFLTFHYTCCLSTLPNYLDVICRNGCVSLNQNLRK